MKTIRKYKITIDDLKSNSMRIKNSGFIGSKKVGLPANQKDFASKIKEKSDKILKEKIAIYY